MYYDSSTGRTTVQTPRLPPQTKPPAGVTYTTNYVPPWSPTPPPAATPKPQQAYAPPPTSAPKPGVLSGPGHYEQWYAANKDRLGAPTEGFGAMKEAADYFRGPNRTAAYADRMGGYFNTPGMEETFAAGAIPQLQGKGYTEQLYESGNQGLNTYYDREWQKRRQRLEDTMSAAGVFGSGATARGLFELEAELGSQQARDMAGLASSADSARGNRLGLGSNIAAGGQRAGENRIQSGADLQNLADASVDRQGRGLLAAGQGMDAAEGAALERAGGGATKAQDFFENREGGRLKAEMTLADRLSSLSAGFSNATTAEQAAMREDVIQLLITEAGLDRQSAEAMAEEWLTSAGNLVRARK